MPVYTYRCDNHGKRVVKPRFAYIQRSILESEKVPNCVECGEKMQRVYDAPPVSFMGSGWGKDR